MKTYFFETSYFAPTIYFQNYDKINCFLLFPFKVSNSTTVNGFFEGSQKQRLPKNSISIRYHPETISYHSRQTDKLNKPFLTPFLRSAKQVGPCILSKWMS